MSDPSTPAGARESLSAVPETADPARDVGPLAVYAGVPPAAPDWVTRALAQAPEVSRIDVHGAQIEVMVWGELGAPGLLLLHGNGAHAGWWRFIAPALAQAGYRVAAFSFAGMGGSDWRETYHIDHFMAEILGVIDHAGLAASGQPPILCGHSFGGFPAIHVALTYPERVDGLIILDSSIEPPGEEWKGPPKRTAPNRVYPSLADALSRFRLAPPQACDNHWALDLIARESLKPVEGGWTWRFDPFIWNSFSPIMLSDKVGALTVPTLVVRGADSFLMGARTWAHMRAVMPAGTGFVTIPEANHHLLLDQPLATISVIATALETLTAA